MVSNWDAVRSPNRNHELSVGRGSVFLNMSHGFYLGHVFPFQIESKASDSYLERALLDIIPPTAVLSCFDLSGLVLSCGVMCCLVPVLSSCLILSCLVLLLSRVALFCHVLSETLLAELVRPLFSSRRQFPKPNPTLRMWEKCGRPRQA